MAIEMTLTRALNEVKMLEKKIYDLTNSGAKWVALSKNEKVQSFQDIAAFKAYVLANKQSAESMISRRNTIKSKLLEANNKTTVTIAGKVYTIAEAIDRKAFLQAEILLLNQIRHNVAQTSAEFDMEQRKLDEKVQVLVSTALQGDGKKDATLVAAIEKNYKDNNRIVVEDPASITSWVQSRVEEVSEFQNEIDFVLSEINAITKIVVD